MPGLSPPTRALRTWTVSPHVADLEEIAGNDFNLNISRYVDTTEPVEVMPVEEALAQLREAEGRRDEAVARMGRTAGRDGVYPVALCLFQGMCKGVPVLPSAKVPCRPDIHGRGKDDIEQRFGVRGGVLATTVPQVVVGRGQREEPVAGVYYPADEGLDSGQPLLSDWATNQRWQRSRLRRSSR